MKRRSLFPLLPAAAAGVVLARAALARGVEPALPPPADLSWWREARFGMFVHWGPVSLRGTEIGWSRGKEVPVEEYDTLYRRFDPALFDARAWARLAKDAGMRYLVLTTKHHDGFCLWPSALTDYDIASTPFRRDVVRELADACRAEGIVFGAYHSICDWRHPDYPLGSPGGRTRKPAPNMERYTAYLKGQVTELLRSYGPSESCGSTASGRSRGQRSAGSTSTVTAAPCSRRSSSTTAWRRGGRTWPAPPPTGPSAGTTTRPSSRWAGSRRTGRGSPASPSAASGRGSPTTSTRGGPFRPGGWGACTHRGHTAYLHVLEWPATGPLVLPPLERKVGGSSVVGGGVAEAKQTAAGTEIRVAPGSRRPIDTVVRLELDGPADTLAPR